MDSASSRFSSAPAFYSVASSQQISKLVDERTAAIYELGLQDLQLSPGGGALPDKERRFEAGLLDSLPFDDDDPVSLFSVFVAVFDDASLLFPFCK